jgi:inosine/xanthosine triphosphatase
MKIIIGSKNPAKIGAVESIFNENGLEVIPIDVPSGVSEQPFTDDETIKGAVQRAEKALEEGCGDIGIGLEGGVQNTEAGLFLCNWGALAQKGKETIIAGGARIPLPQEVAAELLAGRELGPVMDEYAQKENIRKKEGAIGVFTNGRVDRAEMFAHVVRLLAGQFEYQSRKRERL